MGVMINAGVTPTPAFRHMMPGWQGAEMFCTTCHSVLCADTPCMCQRGQRGWVPRHGSGRQGPRGAPELGSTTHMDSCTAAQPAERQFFFFF